MTTEKTVARLAPDAMIEGLTRQEESALLLIRGRSITMYAGRAWVTGTRTPLKPDVVQSLVGRGLCVRLEPANSRLRDEVYTLTRAGHVAAVAVLDEVQASAAEREAPAATIVPDAGASGEAGAVS